MTLDEAVAIASKGGVFVIKEYGDYFVDVKKPNLFETGNVKLRAWAHHDSMNDHPTIYTASFSELKDTVWDLFRYEEPIETIWGDF